MSALVSSGLAHEHGQRSAYKPNLSINVGWGLDPDEEFPDDGRELQSEWSERFPDKRWSFNYCDFFYNGNLVDRAGYAVVDGGRALLPLPDVDGRVSRWEHDWFRVLDDIGLYTSEFDSYFERAGFTVG